MIKKLALAAGLWAAGTLLVLAAPAQAALIGQTVNASFNSLSSWSLNRTSATVSATAREFVFTNAPSRRITVDVRDSSIDFQYNNIFNIFFFPGDLSITIGGLTWAPNPRVIIGVNVTEFDEPNSIGGFGANIASFTDSSVTLALNGVWDGRDRVRIDLITGPAQLPEPASFALFGVGLLGLGIAVRRRGQRPLHAARAVTPAKGVSPRAGVQPQARTGPTAGSSGLRRAEGLRPRRRVSPLCGSPKDDRGEDGRRQAATLTGDRQRGSSHDQEICARRRRGAWGFLIDRPGLARLDGQQRRGRRIFDRGLMPPRNRADPPAFEQSLQATDTRSRQQLVGKQMNTHDSKVIRRRSLATIGALFAIVTMSADAGAAPVVYNYSGECTSFVLSQPPISQTCAGVGLSDGDPITGSITFDDTDFGPNARIDKNDIISFTFDTGIFVIDHTTVSGLRFSGDLEADGVTFRFFSMAVADALAPASGNGLAISSFGAREFGQNMRCNMAGCAALSGDDPIARVGNQSLIRVSQISEPGALSLLGIGLAALAAARRRRSR